MDGLRSQVRTYLRRLRRLERREIHEFRTWLETTTNLIHITILLVVPLVIAVVTALSNAESFLPFILFPPLASGTYTLFADPEGKYSSPTKFVEGITAGAVCGSVAVLVALALGVQEPTGEVLGNISPLAAALAVFLTGATTWALDTEEPSAFSTALLALIAPAFTEEGMTPEMLGLYVASVLVASSLVAGVFSLWHDRFYERRAKFLYQSTKGDDHVLVPIRGDHPVASVMLAAQLVAAHDAGKVVLLEVVESKDVAAEQELLERETSTPPGAPAADDELTELAEERATADTATDLETLADRVENEFDIPCQVLVAVESTSRSGTVLTAARQTNCDLIVTPYEEQRGGLSPFVRELFGGHADVLVHRSGGETTRTEWRNVLVPVRRANDVAHAMLDFAKRLTESSGRIAVCHCIGPNDDRRRAESMLSDIVETFHGSLETRLVRQPIETFLARSAGHFDLVIIGASTDRSAASRFISPPTFERIHELECDVAILDRNYRY